MISLLVIFSCPLALAEHANDKAAVERAKAILVSSLDSSLPKVSLEFFLKYEAGGEPIHWAVNDCGDEGLNHSTHRGQGSGVCVEADFDFKHQAVAVSIALGKDTQKSTKNPSLDSAVITGMGGNRHPLRRLGELPAQLHRPLRRVPRDLPLPTGAM